MKNHAESVKINFDKIQSMQPGLIKLNFDGTQQNSLV